MTGPIIVVGLGPGDSTLRTLATQQTLDQAERIVLRTAVHPGVADLAADPRVVACDDLYERGETFDAVYDAIADRVIGFAQAGPVVYAVPGHPRFAERSVGVLLDRASEQGIRTEVQSAVSLIDVVATAIARDPVASEAQLLDAAELSAIVDAEPFSGGRLAIDPARPVLIAQVYDTERASAVKLALGRLYPDEHEVVVVRAAGVPGEERIAAIPLHALDRQPVDHLTSVWVDPLPSLAAARSPQTLQRIVARLRAPGGCPWDRAQTHETLRRAVVEEAYETVDAIDAGDAANLAEELGDLLLQVALHAQLAEEAGLFALEDVYDHISRKLVRRHPHVFGEVDAATPADVVRTWEAVKAEERASAGAKPKPANPLDRLPRAMPAFDKATALLSPRKGSAVRQTTDAELREAGGPILAAIDAAVVAGLEPDAALAAALRHRFQAVTEPALTETVNDGKEDA